VSFVDHSKAWIVCDAPDCDNEFILSKAEAYGWQVTGTAGHLCPNHAADHPEPDVVDVKALAAGER
jgi:hypothetical protein